MADPKLRLPQNAGGPFYIDESCIDCDLCRETSPGIFSRDEDIGKSFVHHQPVTPEEWEMAEEARMGCPTESIGNDGLAP